MARNDDVHCIKLRLPGPCSNIARHTLMHAPSSRHDLSELPEVLAWRLREKISATSCCSQYLALVRIWQVSLLFASGRCMVPSSSSTNSATSLLSDGSFTCMTMSREILASACWRVYWENTLTPCKVEAKTALYHKYTARSYMYATVDSILGIFQIRQGATQQYA